MLIALVGLLVCGVLSVGLDCVWFEFIVRYWLCLCFGLFYLSFSWIFRGLFVLLGVCVLVDFSYVTCSSLDFDVCYCLVLPIFLGAKLFDFSFVLF